MEKRNKCVKVGLSTILCGILVVFLCAAPCGALTGPQTVDLGDTLNLGTDYAPDKVGVDNGSVYVYGTLNMYSGAYVDWYVTAITGSTVNIKGGTVGMLIDVALGAEVTVYGTYFEFKATEYFAGEDLCIRYSEGPLKVTYENGNQVNLPIDCFYQSGGDYATVTLAAPGSGGPTPIDIDIKPGSYPNPINQGSNGLIPVAIFTTDDFDAADVDPDTVTLNGIGVAVRGKAEKLMARLEDVDGDGDYDLILQVEIQSEGVVWESGPVTLTGQTYGGEDIEGTDEVVIVPPE